MSIEKGILISEYRLLHNRHKEIIIQSAGCVDILHIVILKNEHKRYSNIRELSIAISKILTDIGIEFHIHTSESEIESEIIKKLNIEDFDTWRIFTNKEDKVKTKIKKEKLELFSSEDITVENIEKDMYNSKDIAKEFMRYINKKIVISGTESCGKTVMTKKLASLLDTSFSEEYGRYHGRKFLGGNDNCFSPKEFVHIAMEQILQDKKINMYARLYLIVDTDIVVTLNFLYKYRSKYIKTNRWDDELEQEYIDAKKTLKNLISKHSQNLTFLLKPNVQFVEDGIRWKDIGLEERLKEFNKLRNIYDEFDIEYKVISKTSYNERLKEVMEYIRKDKEIM